MRYNPRVCSRAGMGRAPAVALAYMWWCKGIHLDDGYATLLSKRACSPKLYAVRQAVDDILYAGGTQSVTITKRGSSMSETVEIAGASSDWSRGALCVRETVLVFSK